MKKLSRYSMIISILSFSILACRDEFHQLTPPQDPNPQVGQNPACKAPAIEQNIVGTWHFESTFNPEALTKPGNITSGTITFTNKKTINDPDSLFESHIDVNGSIPVTAKTYEPDVPSKSPDTYSGKVFEIYLATKKGKTTYYFIVVSNECNRVHMRFWQSENNSIGFVLTR